MEKSQLVVDRLIMSDDLFFLLGVGARFSLLANPLQIESFTKNLLQNPHHPNTIKLFFPFLIDQKA
jgi:hypothetical protein